MEQGKSNRGGNLSWNQIARYGVPPLGFADKADSNVTAADMDSTCLCRYLSEDGTTLMPKPQDIWRMPTADETVRSLVHHGKNAGCEWDGESERADCACTPGQRNAALAPDWSPIYYWAADEFNQTDAYYVSYNGRIAHQPKSWGNPRHAFRCVRSVQVHR